MRIAFVGKGGSGKSVIAGTICRLLAQEGQQVLALDFDTMPGLAYSLGLAPTPNAGIPERYAMRRKKTGWGLKRPITARTLVRRHAVEGPDGIQFLQLGKLPDGVKPASSTAFKHVADTFDQPGWSVVGDFAAGTRQGFFGWAKFAPVVAIVVEPSQASLLSARRLRGLREIAPEVHLGAVLSKVRPDTPVETMTGALDLPVWGIVPYDTGVRDAERRGQAPIDGAADGAAVTAIRECLARIRGVPAKEPS